MDDLSNILHTYLIVVGMWLIVAVFSLISIVKKKDISLLLKVFWCAVIILAPVIGLIIYIAYNTNKERRI